MPKCAIPECGWLKRRALLALIPAPKMSDH